MQGTDVESILVELKKNKIPGLDNVYKLLEILNQKITQLEGILNVAVTDFEPNRKTKSDAQIGKGDENKIAVPDSNRQRRLRS